MSDSSTDQVSKAGTRRPRSSRRARVLFVIFCLAVPVVVLGVLEGALRIAGFGGYPPTIRRVAQVEGSELYITDSPGPASYFFANRSKSGSINQYSLVMPKPADTVRILAVGESAMQGFPEPMGFASTAFLQRMLASAWPEKRVEVINLGTTAVASFPVLGMLTEGLEFSPDLVVIYCGNNEFFGAYGVSSLHSAGRTPGAIRMQRRLRSLAIVQAAASLAPSAHAEQDRTLMEAMVRKSYTGPDDPSRGDAERNFREHIGAMIDRSRDKGVPVIVCTLASNEKDLAPMGSVDLSGLPVEQRTKVEGLVASGERASESDPAAAEASLREALGVAPAHARAHYFLGRALLAQGRRTEAAAAFQKAIDLDSMPWRPPGDLNQVLIDTAAARGVVLCDVRQAFRDASPDGCIGWELMDDHVHPSLKGQWMLARSIASAMTKLPSPLTLRQDFVDGLPGFEAAAVDVGENPYDRYGVAHTLRVLCSTGLFTQTSPWAFARFDAQAKALEAAMPAGVQAVAREWQKATTHTGGKRPMSAMAAQAILRSAAESRGPETQERVAEAERLFEVALRHVPAYSSWSVEYSYFVLACRLARSNELTEDDRVFAQAAIDRGKLLLGQGRSASGDAERYVGRLMMLRGEFAEAIPFLVTARPKLSGMDLVAADKALVECYVRTGKKAEAEALVQRGIEQSGQFSGYYEQMKKGLGGE